GSQATATGLSAGVYVVTVQDSNGCETTESFEISSSVAPVITGGDSETICAGDSVVLTPTVTPAGIQGFVGDFASNNWTQTSNNSNGSIVFSDTNSVMISSNGAGSGSGFNQAVIAMPSNATISFDWSYTTSDGAQWDYPQLFLNGNLSLFNGYSTGGSPSQSGTQTIALEAGQLFGFRMISTDNQLGAATVTITNFEVNTNQYSWVASNGGVISGAANNASLEAGTSGTYTLTVTNGQGCSDSFDIAVVVNQTPLPTAAAAQSFNAGATIASIVVTGENLTWYDAMTGGNTLPTNTLLVDATTYYVSQTVNGCESARVAVGVTINLASMGSNTCNSTLNSAAIEFIFADVVANATQYEFKLVNGTNEQTIVRNTNSFRFGDLGFSNFTYGTTYQISVRAFVNNQWTDYSASCPVTLTALPLTSMDGFCNQTMPEINSKIYFHLVPQATEYRFSVTNVLTNEEQFATTNIRFFYITDVANYDFNTQYSIKCQVKIDGQFGDFGPACTLTTPAAPLTQLRPQFCNSTLPNFNANVYAEFLVGATAYKFKVENNGNMQEIERPDSRFTMAFASNISPNTTYNVSVSVFFNGAWRPYGNVCTVTTPALPTTQLRTQFCGGSVTAINSNFFANLIVGATAYRFKTMIAGNEVVVERTDSRCFMSAFAGATMNQTYPIQVAVKIGDNWSEYGAVCNLTVGSVVSREIPTETIADHFEIKAYPNPFTSQINLILADQSVESTITAFDMMGKQIKQITTSAPETILGSDWAAGVYVVQIEQGTKIKNIRMVKQ
ncbi:MAG: T9SS type A sorting domain-containing protein, partial [Flavobacterium sp.]